MATPLRLLLLEDNPADAELALHALRRAGYDPIAERVECEKDYRERLQLNPDIILADFSMPEFDSLRALEIMQECQLDIPFIIVSGTIGEERAVHVMQRGATDYIIKDRLGRLGQAVTQALEKKRMRSETWLAERRLNAQHTTTKILAESPDLETAIPQIIETICKSVGCVWAAVWMVNPQCNTLDLAQFWHSPSDSLDELLRVCREKTFAHGEGLPGRSWATGEPTWSPDVMEEENFFGKFAAAKAGLHAALIVPILIGREVVGVIEFLSQRIGQPDKKLLGMTAAIGTQIGQFIERKRIEDRFRQAQQRLEHVVASSPAVLFTLAVEGNALRLDWISDNVREMTGYTAADALRLGWWDDCLHPDEREQVRLETGEVFAHGHKAHEYRFRHCEGQYVWVRAEMRLLRDAAGNSVEVVGSWSDITERKLIESQFRQAQKMEAFGQLAGGVAHDFNNLLTVISGYSEMLLGSLQADDLNREPIREIHKAGERATLLTKQLLAFSRKQVVQPQVINLNSIVAGMEKMLVRLIGEDVILTTELATSLNTVKADPGQIEQVIMNLVVNARDAMPKGGRIAIKTADVDLDEKIRQSHPDVKPGRYVLFALSDTGDGMTEDVKRHIFEPFFTTKEVGKGTGLGLATVFGIVNQSSGHIEVDSDVGRGTRFRIFFPSIEKISQAELRQASQTPVLSGTETILVVEDDKAVRTLTRSALQPNGYTLLEAADGEEAISLCKRRKESIHLLISDVVMPRMGGRQLAERLTASHPEMRVLFVSGYTDDAMVRHGVLQSEVAFLQKPFSIEALQRKVRAVLDSKE